MPFSKWISDTARRGGDATSSGDQAAAAEARNELTAALATGKITYQDWDDTITQMLSGDPHHQQMWKNRQR